MRSLEDIQSGAPLPPTRHIVYPPQGAPAYDADTVSELIAAATHARAVLAALGGPTFTERVDAATRLEAALAATLMRRPRRLRFS